MSIFPQYSQALLFYLMFFLFTLIGLPFTIKIFQNKLVAWGTAKLLGLSVFGYAIWLLSAVRILNYQWTVVLYLLLISALAASFYYLRKEKILPLPWRSIITWEIILLVLYFAYLYMRSFNPATYGTERFMDMMLMTSSSKSSHFPFTDSWYGGKLINYYYYGQYLLGMLARLTHINYSLAYNFCLGLLYSTATGFAGLFVYQITKSKIFSALAAFFVTTAGNLFYAGCVISSYQQHQPICSYASSTRLYTPSYIINEIPSYSFTVGDLHAHFIALPFFLLSLFFLYQFFQAQKLDKWLFFTMCVTFTTSALINPTDVVSLGLLAGAIILYKIVEKYKRSVFNAILNSANWIFFGIGLILTVGILSLPFTYSFHTPVLGFGFAPSFAADHNLFGQDHQYPTPFLAQLGMWGAFLIFLASFFAYRKNIKQYGFSLLLLLTSVFLVVFVELFFVKDIYHIANPPFFRANTTFKFGYHIWTFLSLGFACCCYFLLQALRPMYKKILYAFIIIFVFFSSFYPYQAIEQFYVAGATDIKSLDGLQFMQTQYPDDYATIRYIDSLKTRPVVLEAVGDSYTYFARISAFSGSISPMGWKTHEWTWRFDGSSLAQQRMSNPNGPFETGYGPVATVAQDVQTIYENPNLDFTKQLLKKYNIEYVYIGNQERSTYSNLNEQKFSHLGDLIFSSGNSKLFRIK